MNKQAGRVSQCAGKKRIEINPQVLLGGAARA
jgi:hypothetical protein